VNIILQDGCVSTLVMQFIDLTYHIRDNLIQSSGENSVVVGLRKGLVPDTRLMKELVTGSDSDQSYQEH